MSFTGFPPAGRVLLAHLPSLDPDGFAAERAGWDELLLQPARHFVTDLGAVLADRVSPGLVNMIMTSHGLVPTATRSRCRHAVACRTAHV